MNTAKKLKVAFTRPGNPDHTLGRAFNESLTWQQLVERLSVAKRDTITQGEFLSLRAKEQGAKKNIAGAFVGGSFNTLEEVRAAAAKLGDRASDAQKGGRNRNAQEFISRQVLTLDIDGNAKEIWDDLVQSGYVRGLESTAHQVHTTRKHTEDKPRFRIVVPLTRPVTAEEYTPLVLGVFEKIDPTMGIANPESLVAVQVMFMPTISSDGEFFHMTADGEWLDPDKFLEKYPADNPDCWPLLPDGKRASAFTRRKKEHPEDKKHSVPIITAVHRAYAPEDFIETFLSEFYENAGEGRYGRIGSQDAPAVVIYEHAFIHSFHGSDPANGQHNCFDNGRLWLFGELDKDHDTKEAVGTELPSYRAMFDLMMAQPEVREAYEEVLAEAEAERAEVYGSLLPDLDDEDEDDEDDLIGAGPVEQPKTLEAYCARVFELIRVAKGIDDLQAVCDAVSQTPDSFLPKWRRDNFAPKIRDKCKALDISRTLSEIKKDLYARRTQRDMSEMGRPEWLSDFVYVTSTNAFYDTNDQKMTPFSKDALNNTFFREAVETYGIQENGNPLKWPLAAALGSRDPVPVCRDIAYLPQEPTGVIEVEGMKVYNSYFPASIPRSTYRGREGVDYFLRLVADMFPDKTDQALYLDYIAHCVKFPGVKIPYALLVKGVRGEGKSTVKDLMLRMIGKHNVGSANNDTLKEKYTSFIYRKCLTVLEETKVNGVEGYQVMEKLKPFITDGDVPMRVMHKDPGMSENCCNFYFMTNHENALPIEDRDNRYLVLFTRFNSEDEVEAWAKANEKAEGFHYVEKLRDHIRDHPWQFKVFFDKYQFSEHYKPKRRAPWTKYRGIVAFNAQSEPEKVLNSVLDDPMHPCISSDILVVSYLKEVFADAGIDRSLHAKGGSSFLVPMGFRGAKNTLVKEGGRTVKYAVYTKNRSFIGDDGKLTADGKAALKCALDRQSAIETSDLEDLDQEDDLI